LHVPRAKEAFPAWRCRLHICTIRQNKYIMSFPGIREISLICGDGARPFSAGIFSSDEHVMTTEKQLRADILRAASTGNGKGGLRRQELRRRLGRVDERHFRETVRQLVSEGLLLRRAGGRYEAAALGGGRRQKAAAERRTAVGTIQVNNKGFAFVTPENAPDGAEDYFVPPGQTGGALSGDRVQLVLPKEGNTGAVEKILSRARDVVVGCLTWQLDGGYGIRPLRRDLPPFLALAEGTTEEDLGRAQLGDWVAAKLLEQTFEQALPRVEITSRLGREGSVAADLKAIVREYDLPAAYAAQSEEQAAAVTPLDVPREDCRALTTMTIDPPDAKDFDDALSVEPGPQPGQFTLGVHIADVACFAPAGSRLDRGARMRGFTSYLPGLTLPMLPKSLATDRCSLREGEERLAHSVFLQIDAATGEVLASRRVHTVICSRRRFSYDEVERFLAGEKLSGLADDVRVLLERLGELSAVMRKRRATVESFLPMTLPEMQVLCGGQPPALVGLRKVEASPAHELVEEMMLAANEAVAREMLKTGLPGLFRNHAAPEPEQMEMFAAQAEMMGLGKKLHFESRSKLIRFMRRLGSDSGSQLVNLALLRCLPRAQYQLSNNGHFGLGKDVYCHFTSPIRRYPDLLVHQQLLARDLGTAPRTASTLAELANACNAREQNVDQAAFAAADRLKLRHLANQVSDRAAACLEGVIFRVTTSGLTVYLEEYGLMGFLDIRHLGEDVWQCDEKRLALVHRYSGEKRRFGDTIYVRPLVVDTVRNDLQLAPAGMLRDF